MNLLKLKKLTLENFGIYKGVTELDFEGKDVIGIIGEYRGAVGRSNRAGKTLIQEAIKYNLIGVHRYSKVSKMIHNGEDMMMTTSVYSDSNGNEYTIRRGADHKNGVLNIDWTEKSKESQAAINDLFGISADDFDLTLFFKQGEINGFMNYGPAKKTEYLMKWMDNEHWKGREEAVKKDIKKYRDDIKENETTIKALVGSLQAEENLDVEIGLLEKKLKKEKIALNKKKKNREEITKKYTLLKEKRSKAVSKIKELEAKLEDTQEKMKGKEKAELNIKETKNKIIIKKKKLVKGLKEPKDLIEKSASMKAEIRTLKKAISEASNHEGGICPILQETCDRIKPDKKKLASDKAKIKKYQEEIIKNDEELEKWEEQQEIKNSIKDLQNKLERFELQAETKIEYVKDDLIEDIESYKSSLNTKTLQKLKDDEYTARVEVSDAEGIVSKTNVTIGALKEKIESTKRAREEADKLENATEILRKKLEIYQNIAVMFSKKGIAADEIENAFQEVENDINYLLKELKSDLTVSFKPDKELTKKEPICSCGFKFPKRFMKPACPECNTPRMFQRADEITLKFIENGVECDFEGDSGGGKTILSYAIRIAMTLLKRRQNKCKLNMLFLDEVDTALDKHFAASITDSITKLLINKLGYDQILMISHKEEIKEAIPHIIKVTRDGEASTARFI